MSTTLPSDFNWRYYLYIYTDLFDASKHLTSDKEKQEWAENHYITSGCREGRVCYNLDNMLPFDRLIIERIINTLVIDNCEMRTKIAKMELDYKEMEKKMNGFTDALHGVSKGYRFKKS